jgi:hypothetical protein
MNQAYNNDKLIEAGQPVDEQYDAPNDKVLVWPDLVYVELITIVLFSAFMLVWSIGLPAPLEEPANPSESPNPAKAPWYFLGLQEMLVYFDPWMAGVVLPSLIIVGLMGIPYMDNIKEVFKKYDYSIVKSDIKPLRQRNFSDPKEKTQTISLLHDMEINTKKYEDDGNFYADFYIAKSNN